MKVYIGPYNNWIGPHQIAEKLMFWADKEKDDRVYKLGNWLAKNKDGSSTLLAKFSYWIFSKNKRKVKVKIHGYDTWNADHTICLVIHPILVEFRKHIGGIAAIEKEDVPESLHSTFDYEGSVGFSKEAYEWVIDEMIWAFDPEWDDKHGFGSENYEYDTFKEYWKRRENGLRLFGRYLPTLWN